MNRIRSMLAFGSLMIPAIGAHANDFPTLDRVLYVHECMRDHPGTHYEMVSKCSCALDRLAGQISHSEYIAMKTAADARSIGGERGAYIRANKDEQKAGRRFVQLNNEAKKGCFIKLEKD